MNKQNFISNFLELSKILSRKNKLRLLMLVIMMFVSGIAEIITLGSVYPFLASIINSDILFNDGFLGNVLIFLGLDKSANFLMLMSLFFCSAVVISSSIRIFITWLNYKWSYELAADLVIKNYKSSLYESYLTHISRNSSEMISAISHKTSNLVGSLVLPFLNLIQLTILSASILAGLIILLPIYYLIIISVLGIFYLFLAFRVRKRLVRNSEVISLNQIRTIKILQESLNGIKDIILGNYYDKFIDDFSQSERPYRRGYGSNAFLVVFPRFLIEAIGILIIVFLAYLSFSSSEDPSSTLPTIGILVLAIQRLLPYLQQIYQAYGSIKGNTELNSEVIKMLVEGNKIKTVSSGNETENFHFNNSIELKNVDFGYTSANNFALNNVSVKIYKGQKVGIIGSTGSGKSTLVDFLMGLLPFKEGEIIVDDIKLTENLVPSWQKIILHVPQSIFLSDGSIRSNIAFGERTNQISESRILDVIESSHLTEYIDSLPEGLETKVGERGLQLSGGQIQRIGIARSLYKGGDILILDEATNSLDKETEINIVKTIKKLDKKMTMIMIAHNLSTLEGCDMLIIMEKGKVIRTGSYNEVVTSKEFKKISGEMSGK